MTNFLQDLDVVDPSTVETGGQLYPVGQWLNGDPKLAAAGGVAHSGGLILPTKYVPDDVTPAPGWTHANVAFGSGKTEQVLAAQKPRLAVVRTRFRWFVIYNGVTTYYPRAGYVASSGMRGHVQALCGLAGYDFPVVVTFKGKASQEFERLLREFSQKVGDAAHRLLRGQGTNGQTARFPRFAFYWPLAAGPHQKVGQKGQESIVTLPVSGLPEALTEDYLSKTYVGREKLLDLQQLYHDSSEWGSAWDKAGAEADDHHEPGADVDPDTGEITDHSAARPIAPAKTDAERWDEFCNEHEVTRADVVKALKYPTVPAYRRAHPEATIDAIMAAILAARPQADATPEPPAWFTEFSE